MFLVGVKSGQLAWGIRGFAFRLGFLVRGAKQLFSVTKTLYCFGTSNGRDVP